MAEKTEIAEKRQSARHLPLIDKSQECKAHFFSIDNSLQILGQLSEICIPNIKSIIHET
jgi:hypothetical protein